VFYLPSSFIFSEMWVAEFIALRFHVAGAGEGIGGRDAIRTSVFREYVSPFPE
jgi:hypothetical protein